MASVVKMKGLFSFLSSTSMVGMKANGSINPQMKRVVARKRTNTNTMIAMTTGRLAPLVATVVAVDNPDVIAVFLTSWALVAFLLKALTNEAPPFKIPGAAVMAMAAIPMLPPSFMLLSSFCCSTFLILSESLL